MTRRAVLRELAHDNIARLLVVIYPLALAAQFVGARSVLEITLSLVFIGISAVLVARSLYRSAEYRVEDRILAAEDAQLLRENPTPGRHRADHTT